MILFLIFIGLIGLWFGTKWMIESAIGIANRLNISQTFVGVAILAVGTDLPEVFVTINASIKQLNGIESSGIITGNAIGSCFSQITLILGVVALLLSFKIENKVILRDGVALSGSLLLLFFFGIDGMISRIEGSFLLIAYLIYYVILLKSKEPQDNSGNEKIKKSNLKLGGLLIIGLIILIFSSNLVVENAMLLTEKLGISQSIIGITIIGLGTSLPELAVSVGAALKKSPGMSIGNVIGSNIFDGLIPIGLGGTISTVKIERNLLYFDIPLLFGTTAIVLYFLQTKNGLTKSHATIMIAIFFLYLILKFNMI